MEIETIKTPSGQEISVSEIKELNSRLEIALQKQRYEEVSSHRDMISSMGFKNRGEFTTFVNSLK